jgi:cellulose biosynthesis protein BcsQ
VVGIPGNAPGIEGLSCAFERPDNPQLLGYLFTMSEPTINAATSLQVLRQTYTEKVLKTVIPRNTDLRDAHFQKMDIFSFNPRAKTAHAYNKLIREVFLPSAEPSGVPGARAPDSMSALSCR